MNPLTCKLGSSNIEVLAKPYHGEPYPVTYANRTQAERKLVEMGPGWYIRHTGRPFYIAKEKAT